MGDDAWPKLEKAIRKGKPEKALAILDPLDEPARRALSKRAAATLREFRDEPEGGWSWERRRRKETVAQLVAFATCGPAAAHRLPLWWTDDDRDRIVRTRSRAWRQDWAERAMDEEDPGGLDWEIVHGLIRDGLIDRPTGIGYAVGAISAFRIRRAPLADSIRAEREWMSTTFWRLFEIEEASLTGRDFDFPGNDRWQDVLVVLAADGTVPRERLLDESLAALRRDFSPYNARWFHQLFEQLEPTPDELSARSAELLTLLASADSAIVGFALRAVGRLEKAGRLDAAALADAIAPALVHPAKSHAARATKLAGRVLKGRPELASLMVDALAHEAREVQDAAVKVLAKAPNLGADDRERLAALTDVVDAALRAEVAALAGVTIATAPAGPAVVLPPAVPYPTGRPRLGTPLVPVSGIDDLLDRAAVVLERVDDPDEAELVLDGISRLRDQPVDPGRAQALLARADPGPAEGAPGLVGVALLRWLGGRPHCKRQVVGHDGTALGALGARVGELVGELPGGRPRPVLCTPTHAGGWIDPAVAVDRVGALTGDPPVLELAQLVLRLAPDGREAALHRAEQLDGEAAAVLVRALGGASEARAFSRLGPAWEAALDAQAPHAFVLPVREIGAEPRWSGLAAIATRGGGNPTAALASRHDWMAWGETGEERWLLTVWPANAEPLHQLARIRLTQDLGRTVYGVDPMLEHLLDPAEPLGPEALILLSLALGASDGARRTLAVDVALAALTDRRLDGPTLGAALGRLLREHRAVVPSRWAETLGAIAAAGPLGAHEAQRAIEAILAADRSDRKRLLKLVDVLRTVAVGGDCAVADPDARAWLEALPPKSKTGRAAREALAVTGDGAARSRAALAEVTT